MLAVLPVFAAWAVFVPATLLADSFLASDRASVVHQAEAHRTRSLAHQGDALALQVLCWVERFHESVVVPEARGPVYHRVKRCTWPQSHRTRSRLIAIVAASLH